MFLVHFLLDNGIGQNITAGALTIILGYLWSKTKFWPLNILHDLYARHEELHAKIDDLHEKHDRLHADHQRLHKKLDALASVSGPETSNTTTSSSPAATR